MVSIETRRSIVRRNREEQGGNKVISAFPSKEYQKYMETSLDFFSPMQMATLAVHYMKKRKLSKFLRELRKQCYFPEQRGFLRSASHDVMKHSFKRRGFSEKTEHLYERMCKAVPGEDSHRVMFSERCMLSCIVDEKDIVSFKFGKKKLRYGIVYHIPHYSDKDFDLSDEFIWVYDLSESPIIENGYILNNDILLLPPDTTKVPESHLPLEYRKNYEKYKQAFLDGRISIKEVIDLQTDFDEGIIAQLFTTIKTIEKNSDKCVFMFISACVDKDRVFDVMGKKKPNDEKQADKMWKEYNKRSTYQLKFHIKGAINRKWEFISCEGGYLEDTGEEVTEKSFMVWGDADTKDSLIRLGTEWSKRFAQECFFVISDNGTKNIYYDSTGKAGLSFDSKTFDQKFVSNYFTKIHGKKFVLYDIKEEYTGYNNALEGMCWDNQVVDLKKLDDEVYMKFNNEQFELHRKWLFNQIEEEAMGKL